MKISKSIFLCSAMGMALLLPAKAKVELDPIEIEGYKFFDSVSGEYFPVAGIDYYPRPNTGPLDLNNLDLFSDLHENIWKRDIEQFKELGINALRLYAVDPDVEHGKFMSALASAGIYVVIGLAANCVGCEITAEEAPDCYPAELKHRGQRIIQQFSKYSNVLGFSAGNEINNRPGAREAVVCQKKFLRDMREYISQSSCLERKVPVGVVLADTNRAENAQYFNCQHDDKDDFENAEWFGLNSYVLCDGAITELDDAPGFVHLKTSFQGYDYSIPVMLTEYGCINPSFPTIGEYEGQRSFLQSKWLYEASFRDVFAGGFVFEYSTENTNSKGSAPYPFTSYGGQNYGLGYFSPENCDDKNITCQYQQMPNFYNLKKAYESIDELVADEPSRDKFKPEKSRTGRSKCPGQDWFKPLSFYEWEADNLDDLACSIETVTKVSKSHTNFETVLIAMTGLACAGVVYWRYRFVPHASASERDPLLKQEKKHDAVGEKVLLNKAKRGNPQENSLNDFQML